jgi:PAS domain S-box-containing protein
MAKRIKAKAAAKKARPEPDRRAREKPRRQDENARVHSLIHELQVHAEEITVQNEQLLKAQHELEGARDRFADLYDFAPIGYVSLDSAGVVAEINLAAAALLGKPRGFILNLPLSALLVKEHRERFANFVQRALSQDSRGEQSVEVSTRIGAAKTLRLIAQPGVEIARGVVFTAMVDVTEERRLENDRRVVLARVEGLAAERAREIGVRASTEERIKILLERLVTAQEEERRRIARNLHDHLGQQLTALRLTLDTIKSGDSTPPDVREKIELVDKMVTKLDKDVDLLAWDLRPATLDDMGLGAALADLVRQWAMVTAVPAEFHQAVPTELRLAPKAESNVYRIVQEALNNIAKHARAKHVSVMIEHHGQEAAVIIEDDGRGFDPELSMKSNDRHSGMGLIGMRERAALIDGNVEIESKPGHGTTVFVRVPIKSS